MHPLGLLGERSGGKHSHAGFYAGICIIQAAGLGKISTHELTPGYYSSTVLYLSTGGVLLCSCGTIYCPPEVLGTCDFASSCGYENYSRGVWLNPDTCASSGQSRDFLGLEPSPNSVLSSCALRRPLVRRLCYAYPSKFAYACLGTFQSMIS